jgi:hypothetical protein
MKQEFKAVIQQHADMNAAYIEPPFDVEKVFGAKRVKVIATFDGLEYRGSLVRMGGCYMLGMTQEIRKKIGKDFGDTIEVTIEKDETTRIVEVPSDLQEAMKNHPEAQLTFDKLSYTGKREYVLWITEAKRTETRTDRVEKAIARLSEGKKLR